ncbi:MAG: choice-of-anchor J domain-containing protein [Clostridia bacterium]|nr:choice-of-anchor J domain-containing protein [Clostridia bacterium]
MAKKLLALLVAAIMVLVLVPAAAFAKTTSKDVAPLELIDLIEISGYVRPAYGEHPNFNLTVPEGVGYYIDHVVWNWYNGGTNHLLNSDSVFDQTDGFYYSEIWIYWHDGYTMAEHPTVLINGEQGHTSIEHLYEWPEFLVQTEYVTVEEPPSLDDALNIEGGELHFETSEDYPWEVFEDGDRLAAWSTNGGVGSSTSAVWTTVEANLGDVLSFDFMAWGEGTGGEVGTTVWDKCQLFVDDELVLKVGAIQNDWETYEYVFTSSGEHTLRWEYAKDGSVNPTGDYFAVDNVTVSEGPEVIDLVELIGFIVPEYGANPSYSVTVPEGANYYIADQYWLWTNPDGFGGSTLQPSDTFDNPDIRYFEQFSIRANEGYVFADNPTVTLDGSTDNLYAPNVIDPDWLVIQTARYAVEGSVIEPVEYGVTGFEIPVYGGTPAYDIEVLEGADYHIEGGYWYWCTDEAIGGPVNGFTDASRRYFYAFYLVNNDYSDFPEDRIVTINGTTDLVGDSHTDIGWIYDEETGEMIEYPVLYVKTIDFSIEEPVEPVLGYYFESDDEIADFIFLDVDGDGYSWSRNTQSSYAYEGTGSMGSRYNYTTNVDNWMIMPEFHVPETDPSMTLYARERTTTYGAEFFSVFVGTDPEDLTTFIQVGTTIEVDFVEYQQFAFDLSAYAGQNVYVAIRHFDCNDTYYLYIDQVEFWGEYDEQPPVEPELIDTIEINDFVVPAWGENPFYNVTVPADAPYTLDYTDWNWWSDDLDDGDILTPSEFFDNENYVYYQYFEIIPNEGYAFADDVTVLINGDATIAENCGLSSLGYFWIYTIDYTVEEPEPQLITEVDVSIDLPEYGANPDFTPEVPDGAHYTISDFSWMKYNETDGDVEMAADDVFDDPDSVYYFVFEISPEDGWDFAEECTATVNGEAELVEFGFPYDGFFYGVTVDLTVEAPFIIGDVNLSGTVEVEDAILALRYAMGLIELTDEQLAQADVDGDGDVDLVDATLILRYAMGLIDHFPIED